jgi:hypothetical protein
MSMSFLSSKVHKETSLFTIFAFFLGILLTPVSPLSSGYGPINIAFAAPAACSSPITALNSPSNFRQAPPGTVYGCVVGPLSAGTIEYYDNDWNKVGNLNTSLTSAPTVTNSATGETKALDEQKQEQIAECAESALGGTFSARCWLVGIVVGIGSAIVSVLSIIPWLVDKLLNIVIENTVLITGFSTLYKTLGPLVQQVWTLIRDLANIAIIGIFVFIAIAIILGLKEYGQKKLIANVLVVAILINFSFLFTRIIINMSNALSDNIYNQLILKNLKAAPSATSSNVPRPAGIGNQFLNDLKITEAGGAGYVGNGMIKTYNSHRDLGALFMHIFIAGFVALVAGLALLYIAFLLIVRFVTLVVLLTISAAAFASYLLPSTQDAMWNKWWNALIKNSLSAPILFVFLWMALMFSDGTTKILITENAANKDANYSAISTTVNSATTGPALSLLLNYILVLGFLFAGVQLANSLTSSLSKRVVAAVPAIGIGAASTAMGYPIAFGAAWRMRRNKKALDNELGKPEPDGKRLARLSNAISRNDALSKKDWNPLNSKAGKMMAKIPGLGGIAAGQFKTTSYGKKLEDNAKKLGNKYGDAIPHGKNEENIRKAASVETHAEATQKELLKAQKETARAIEKQAEATHAAAVQQHKDAMKGVKAVEDASKTQLSAIETQIKAAQDSGDTAEAARLEGEKAKMIREGTDAIQRATADANKHVQVIEEAENVLREKRKLHATAQRNEEVAIQNIAETRAKRGQAAIDNITESLTKYATRLTKGYLPDPNLRAALTKKLKSHHKDHDLASIVKKLKAADDHDDRAVAPKTTEDTKAEH